MLYSYMRPYESDFFAPLYHNYYSDYLQGPQYSRRSSTRPSVRILPSEEYACTTPRRYLQTQPMDETDYILPTNPVHKHNKSPQRTSHKHKTVQQRKSPERKKKQFVQKIEPTQQCENDAVHTEEVKVPSVDQEVPKVDQTQQENVPQVEEEEEEQGPDVAENLQKIEKIKEGIQTIALEIENLKDDPSKYKDYTFELTKTEEMLTQKLLLLDGIMGGDVVRKQRKEQVVYVQELISQIENLRTTKV
ncbi:hypothetical protein AKO1_001086 [Acrasis kona]|uniref:BAG domain-containing protein n=1 Tax=Acrasis kona TaxID=1008807 RepID=A0AAW2ZCV3_9EUKA